MSNRKIHGSSTTVQKKELRTRSTRRLIKWLGIAGVFLFMVAAGVLVWQNNSNNPVPGDKPVSIEQVAPIVSPTPSLEISVEDAFDRFNEGVLMVDVRTQEEWDAIHIPGSIHVPLHELTSRMDEFEKNEEIVVICRSGNRSQEGRTILLQAGFDRVTHVRGGVQAWFDKGLPLDGEAPTVRP